MTILSLIATLFIVFCSLVLWQEKTEVPVIQTEVARWVVTGDFDGNGKTDTLKESYVNSVTNQEINLPQFNSVEYDSLVSIAVNNNPKVSLKSGNSLIPELHIAKTKQLFGICWLRNIGDLNGNGTDEISVVIDWADWSNLNYCLVYTLRDGVWKQLTKIQIAEWQMKEENSQFGGFIFENQKGEFYAEEYDIRKGQIILKELQLN